MQVFHLMDYFAWAVGFSLNLLNCVRFRHLIKDLDPEEEAIFSKLTESTLTTTLYKGKTTEHEHTVEFWFGKMGQNSSGVGQFYGHRNSRMAVRSHIASDLECRWRFGMASSMISMQNHT